MDKAWKPNLRKKIARKVRALRKSRQFTQNELAARLGVSQARFSVIEQGDGSFTAEQFLEILKIFNVPAQAFAESKRDVQGDLQNALARHGASHLLEDEGLLPSEALDEVEALVREVLVDAQNPRQIAALAPVLVRNIRSLNLNGLWARFVDYGLEARLGWALENTLLAIQKLIPALNSNLEIRYLRSAENAIRNFLALKEPIAPEAVGGIPSSFDLVDARTLSQKTINALRAKGSPASQRWHVVSGLQPEDFLEALRASEVYLARTLS